MRSQLGGIAGVASIGIASVGVAVVPIWTFPATSETAGQIGGFAAQQRGALQVMMLLYAAGVTLWLVFGATVWARLRSLLAPESDLPTVFGAGLIGLVTLLLVGFVAFDVLVYRPDVAESRLLYDLAFGMLAMSGLPTAVCLGAFAVAVYRYRPLPRYTGDLAALGAASHVLLLLSFVVGTGFFSLEGAVVAVIPATLWAWILGTAIALLGTPARPRPEAGGVSRASSGGSGL